MSVEANLKSQNLAQELISLATSLDESLKTDSVEQWAKVVREIKQILPALEKLKAAEDVKVFREIFVEILGGFSRIVKLMGIQSVESGLESFVRTVKTSRPKKTAKVGLSGSVEALLRKINDELRSGEPSKSNLLLAMRLVNDIAKILFLNEKKIYNQAIKLQVIYDSALKELFLKRRKGTF